MQRAGIDGRPFADAGGVNFNAIFAPAPCALACQPASGLRQRGAGRGERRAPARIRRSRRLPTGSSSARSTPSGMQISLQTSQSARALRSTGLPGANVAAVVNCVSSSTSPS